jgi:hypothetical protein
MTNKTTESKATTLLSSVLWAVVVKFEFCTSFAEATLH